MFPQQEITTPQHQSRQQHQSSLDQQLELRQQPIGIEQHLSQRQQQPAVVEQQVSLRQPKFVLRQHTPIIQQPLMRGEDSNNVDIGEVHSNNEAVNNEQELLDTGYSFFPLIFLLSTLLQVYYSLFFFI